jgi:hypothetical protein
LPASLRQFARLLETVHRLMYTKDDVGLAEGVSFNKGEDVKEAGENVRGELVGKDFDELGRVNVGSKVKIREINGAEESVVGDNRVKEDVDAGERGDLSGGGRRREDSHRPECREYDGPRSSCSSAGGLGDHFSFATGL